MLAIHASLAVQLLVYGLALGSLPALAQVAPAPGSLSFSSSSALPDAPTSGAARVVAPPQSQQQVDLYAEPVRPFSRWAFGVEGGTLGIGVETATPLARTLQLRGGADFLNFGDGFSVDAAQYYGQAHLRAAHISVDWHPANGSFRISPGLLIFGSGFGASVSVAGGKTFELGNTAYTSSPADPVHGSATISMQRRIMPAMTIGWGNVLSQRSRFTIPFEVGAAYTGHYTATLNLAGTACMDPVGCMSTATQQVQQSVSQEESDLNETMKHYQIYPIVSTGIEFRF